MHIRPLRRFATACLLPGALLLAVPSQGQDYAPAPCGFWQQNGAPQQNGQNGQTGQNATQPSSSPQPEPTVVPAVEKSRRLSQSFRAGRPLSIDTRYGRVQINTWSKAEVKTEVDVISRADTDEQAQQLLDMIQVLMQETPGPEGGIALRTQFGQMPRGCWSRQRLFEVNYTIWMPRNTPLSLKDSFGEVSIAGDLTGPTDLTLNYSSLRTGRLDGPQNSLRLSNSAATVQYARQISFDASYSRLRLDEGQQVELRNTSSDIDMGTVQNLAVLSKYGDVSLGTVRTLQGSSGYTRFSIDKISEQLNMKVQYCPAFEVRTTGRNFRSITLDGGYSTILLNFPDDAGFLFDVNAENGKLLIDKRLVKVRAEENSPSSSEMQGQYGAQVRPAANVNIKTRYSSVSFNR